MPKRGRATATLNTSPFQPRTTRIPEPSLKPLPKRAYDRTDAENKLIVEGEKKAHFDRIRKKFEPEPKETYSKEQFQWAKRMLEQPSQDEINRLSDYDRELVRQDNLGNMMKKKPSAKSGKQIPQLGEQKNQSVPPLIVTSDGGEAFREMDKDWELLDPRYVNAAREQGVTVQEAKERAVAAGISLAQMLGLDDTPMDPLAQIGRAHV